MSPAATRILEGLPHSASGPRALPPPVLRYTGGILNYLIVALAVFSGAWGPKTDVRRPICESLPRPPEDPWPIPLRRPFAQAGGAVAARVSNASFALLSLIYSFTQLLDLADRLTNLAALTARVSQLREALVRPGTPGAAPDARVMLPPCSANGLEVSAHSISGSLLVEAVKVFPELQRLRPESLSVVTTVQHAQLDLRPSGDGGGGPIPWQVNSEMERLLSSFLELALGIRRQLEDRGRCSARCPS